MYMYDVHVHVLRSRESKILDTAQLNIRYLYNYAMCPAGIHVQCTLPALGSLCSNLI